MKKLTSLQILMLMSLAIGSTKIYSQQQDEIENRLEESEVIEDLDQVAQEAIREQETEILKEEVLEDLSQVAPEIVEEIEEEENELKPHFAAIKKFIDKKNKEIEKLTQQKNVDEVQIAKLAVELSDAQAKQKQASAAERSKNKKPHKLEQVVKDNLKKAEQALRKLNADVTKIRTQNRSNYYQNKKDALDSINSSGKALWKGNFSQAGKDYIQAVKKGWSNPFRTPDKKNQLQQPAQAMSEDEMMNEEVAIQSMPSKSKKSMPKKSSQKKSGSRTRKS